MSPLLFHRLAIRSRRHKLQGLSVMAEKQACLAELNGQLRTNSQSCQEVRLKIKQALSRLIQQQTMTAQAVYEVRLLEAVLMRSLLQLETQAEQCLAEKTRIEKEVQSLKQAIHIFGVKEEKMAQAEARLLDAARTYQ